MIHQPHFLPWPGYIARCLAVDTFILLDNVKFKRNHFQQRTLFVGSDGSLEWLTLPIAHATRSQQIRDVRIADSFRLAKWQRRFRDSYQRYAEFNRTWGRLSALIDLQQPRLLDISMSTLEVLIDQLAADVGVLPPRLVVASSISESLDRTERLIELATGENISHLVMGNDALRSHDCERLEASGLHLVQHLYSGPDRRAPSPGVTILDGMFRLGVAEIAARIRSDWSIVPVVR